MDVDPASIAALKGEIEKYAKAPNRFYGLAVKLHDLHLASKKEFSVVANSGLISRRRAYQLKKIAETYQPFECSRKILEIVGFTKALVIAEKKQVDADSVELVLEFATKHTVKELRDYIAQISDGQKKRVFTLHLTQSEYDLYRTTLLAHGAQAHGKGLLHQEAALMQVVEKVAAAGG